MKQLYIVHNRISRRQRNRAYFQIRKFIYFKLRGFGVGDNRVVCRHPLTMASLNIVHTTVIQGGAVQSGPECQAPVLKILVIICGILRPWPEKGPEKGTTLPCRKPRFQFDAARDRSDDIVDFELRTRIRHTETSRRSCVTMRFSTGQVWSGLIKAVNGFGGHWGRSSKLH